MLTTIMIGNKISDARKKLDLSQAQLGEQVFVSSQAVGKWERGESLPDIITLNRIAAVLGVDLNYFSEDFAAPFEVLPDGDAGQEVNNEIGSGDSDKKPEWDMSFGNWVDADFSGLTNLHEKFSSSNMQRCRFIDSDLSALLLKNNNVENCDFTKSDLSKSQIRGSHIAKNIFRECSLKDAVFLRSHLTGCDFTSADFTGSELKGCSIEKNEIAGALWVRTSFNSSHLSGIEFEGAWKDSSFINCDFKKVVFRNAVFNNCFFKNKTLKKIQFINCRADNISYAFLQNGKADMSQIELIK